MDDFIGRKKELQTLTEAWESPGSGFIPIYGRRRVGKSELILSFLRSKTALYFVGKRAPEGLQIREFLQVAATVVDEPLLATYPASSWADAIDAVLARRPNGEKLVLAFDEFQWIVEASPELPSILQERWDRDWQRSEDVLLILCGSYIGFMEREVLGRKSPLFGRRTAQILLRPFDYREAGEFHPDYSLVDRARTYFVCGGVPFYLRMFSQRQSFEMNLTNQLLDEHAALHREPDFLLREELRETESYYAVLLAIAGGHQRAHDIARVSGIPAGSLPYYLKQLTELGYVARRYPLIDGRRNPRSVRYDFDDPLLRFWFRFVFPQQSQLRRLGPERAFLERVEPRLDAYLGYCFERLCREALPWLYEREGVHASYEVGEYWSKQVQIDVVGWRADGWTDLGECKWGVVKSATELERELAAKIEKYPNRRNATLGQRVFTRQPRPGDDDRSSNTRWHTLEDLYV